VTIIKLLVRVGKIGVQVTLSAIIQQTDMALGKVSSALLQLELMGLIAQLPGIRYQRC
jgi:predicted Rossmann fold nucleotide-binding protein DprA/Smf involved in DNA uptake